MTQLRLSPGFLFAVGFFFTSGVLCAIGILRILSEVVGWIF